MQLYIDYLKERLDREVYLGPYGFVAYEITNENCYIVEIFVKKEKRETQIGTKMADEVVKIAKLRGCKTITGTVDLRAKNPEISTQALIYYGFKLLSLHDNYIVFKKEI